MSCSLCSISNLAGAAASVPRDVYCPDWRAARLPMHFRRSSPALSLGSLRDARVAVAFATSGPSLSFEHSACARASARRAPGECQCLISTSLARLVDLRHGELHSDRRTSANRARHSAFRTYRSASRCAFVSSPRMGRISAAQTGSFVGSSCTVSGLSAAVG